MTCFKNIAASVAAVFVLATPTFSQKLLGLVIQKNDDQVEEPVAGANVYWLGTSMAATTGSNGVFMIDRASESNRLVISFSGLQSDTVDVSLSEKSIKVELRSARVLKEVVFEGWKAATGIDHARGINTVVMSEKELFKAACCNLSESFETNPSVDVAFTDAITGTRQIQMLGLSGPNTLISVENMPAVRGLASSQGIQLIPGTWINSIEVTKGTGPVVNGYESIAGQINVELKKPQESDKLYINGYVNQSGRSEANLNYTAMAGKKWATTFLLHASSRPFEFDENEDSFLDFPLGSQLNAINRWVFNNGKGWLGQFGVKILNDTKQGGQKGFNPDVDKFTTNRFGFEINTERYEVWGKMGYQFPMKPYKSVGLQLSATTHNHDSYFGFNQHTGGEEAGYANLIYQSIIGSTAHKFKTGISFQYNRFEEDISNAFRPIRVVDDQGVVSVHQSLDFDRIEKVPGAFIEYSYDYLDRISVIAGIRVDQHNLFGTIVTPRLHSRFNVGDLTSIRLSAGKGTRLANLLIENTGVLVSSREIVFRNRQTNYGFGYKPDLAWNYGLTVSQDFTLNYRPGALNFDYFFTDFTNQLLVDLDRSPQQANFTSLDGKSYSHSVQIQLDYEVIRRFDLRIAYRWLDVRTQYLDGILSRPLIPESRAFINLAYETKSGWKFDYTTQWIGKQRIPDTSENHSYHQLKGFSDDYFLMNAQVTKDLKTRWSIYLGVENITNFMLHDPIISADDPFSDYFDASLVWGPVFGRMAYAGFRYRVK